MDQDLDSVVRAVSEGFSSLAEEYRYLAQQYELLERRLAATNIQVASLRNLVPSDGRSCTSGVDDKNPEDLKICTFRNLDEWLEHMLENNNLKDRASPQTIHRAQLAKLKIRTRSRPDWRVRRRNDAITPVASRTQSRAPSQPTILEEPPMEQDFTEIKTPGDLGCPFAPNSLQASDEQLKTPNMAHKIPAFHDSSFADTAHHSRHPSFVDPLRPQVKQPDPLSPAESVNDSTSIACPIRFLGQHSPEDVAKYFEQHKHELPRSHEVCVKRFQSADSAREIDAKYGSIVTMIQGLGQKHQPMLPEVPNVESAAESNEEQHAKRRIKTWATTVSTFQEGTIQGDVNIAHHERDDPEDDDERVPRFERELGEVRLGESPSRPWGVTIPRLATDNASVSSSVPIPMSDASPSRDAGEERKGELDTLPNAQDDRVLTSIRANRLHGEPVRALIDGDIVAESLERPSGKCPFDHRTSMARESISDAETPKDSALAMKSDDSIQPQQGRCPFEPSTFQVTKPTAAQANATSIIAVPDRPHSKLAEPVVSDQALRRLTKLVNYGTVVVADQTQLPSEGFINRGVLLLGYDAGSAKEFMAVTQASRE